MHGTVSALDLRESGNLRKFSLPSLPSCILCTERLHMLTFRPALGALSRCARCRYRLAMQEHLLRRSSPSFNVHQSRRSSDTPRLSQRQAQRRQPDSHIENLDYAVSASEYKEGLRYRQRRINLYTKDSLGMDSLGRPAEALILRSHDKEKLLGSVNAIPKLDDSVEVKKTASEMLQEIDAERGIVGKQRVAENLEDVRSAWFSKLGRRDKPTEAEVEALAKTLEGGFTHKQLGDYYGPEDLELTDDPDDLSASFSTNLYTRTPWMHGTTPFPRHPPLRLTTIKDAFKARGAKTKPADPKMIYRKKVHKSAIINRIIRQRWRIRTEDDETAMGEIDVWPQREHLRVLQNHSKPAHATRYLHYAKRSRPGPPIWTF